MLSPFGGAVFTMRIVDDAEGRNDLYQGLPLHVMKHNGASNRKGRSWKGGENMPPLEWDASELPKPDTYNRL